jgi:thymidine phosphorylase
MDARVIIAKIRHQQPLEDGELQWFANGLASGAVSDAQAGSFAMAVCLKGLGDAGRAALTQAMCDSGTRMKWDVAGPVLDKHSTGGVGDCVSLVLAPALAACGAFVPMISGRGLGHTGGTLDKMQAIPGLSVALSQSQAASVLAQVGCVIFSANAEIAPADRRLYAVRDVSATIDSIDLITASILSKKLAAGLDGLVLDVKLGSGAFMKQRTEAQALATALVETAVMAGCPTRALISKMDQPLVPSVGNALEVADVVAVLTGRVRGLIFELSAALGGEVLAGAGMVGSTSEGAERIAAAITSGAAAERFGRMVAAQGGPTRFVEQAARYLPKADVVVEVTAPGAGYVSVIDGEALGLAVVALEGGRQVETDVINPATGLSDVAPLGTWLARGDVLARVHAVCLDQAELVADRLRAAIRLSLDAPEPAPLVCDRIVR